MVKKLKALDKKVIILIGLFLGVVVAVASAETMNYTDSAEFCSTCHPMDSAYSSFADSTHANIACNKCHAPTDSLGKKILFKAKAGTHDIYMNTFGADKIPDVIHAKTATIDVIQENCKSCHEGTLNNLSHDAKENCTDCHRQIPHGNGNFKTDEWFKPADYDINNRNESFEKGWENA
ncbi:cytochrome c3 family protein [Cytobacillus sp. IB215665]|uniref:cytochrome c3 family protein n=1 Tax=Cytobacillus sp. IB215665 TaxID=3097357 RepID=UPI002A137115|nr:NapC/NirT family cytochrome c [Cytobacillus sp. IB215665]MDX8364128.1 NapC/NirT family cytochrome c [Cytobacillus sp. IB215665]